MDLVIKIGFGLVSILVMVNQIFCTPLAIVSITTAATILSFTDAVLRRTQVLPFMVHPLWLPFSRIGSVSQHSAAFLSRMSKYRFVVGYHFVLFDCFSLTGSAHLSGICSMTGLLS
jgi:hypothetical protein